jgi:hypothetical protein
MNHSMDCAPADSKGRSRRPNFKLTHYPQHAY